MIVWETIKAHFRVHAKAAPKRHVLHTSHTYSHPFIIFALLEDFVIFFHSRNDPGKYTENSHFFSRAAAVEWLGGCWTHPPYHSAPFTFPIRLSRASVSQKNPESRTKHC